MFLRKKQDDSSKLEAWRLSFLTGFDGLDQVEVIRIAQEIAEALDKRIFQLNPDDTFDSELAPRRNPNEITDDQPLALAATMAAHEKRYGRNANVSSDLATYIQNFLIKKQ